MLQVGRLRLRQVKALVEPRSWDWNPTCDSETCKFNPLPVNCLLPRWQQPVMRSGSGLSRLERTGCLLLAWPRPFAAPLGSRSPGLRCHHLPPTSTCPFGPLCPAGTVASLLRGLQMLPASTWVSSLSWAPRSAPCARVSACRGWGTRPGGPHLGLLKLVSW